MALPWISIKFGILVVYAESLCLNLNCVSHFTIICCKCILTFSYGSLLTFVSNNREQYFTNYEIHNINTRHTSNLHLPRAYLNIYQKGVYYSGIKIFNSLPWDIKTYTDNPRTSKKAVKKFLYTNSFCSLNGYYDNNNIRIHL